MKIYGVLRICDHFYFILQEAGVRIGACDIMSCLEVPECTQCRYNFFLLKIILEVLKIDHFEG